MSSKSMSQSIISKKNGRRGRVIFPSVSQNFAVEELHAHGINLMDFSIYLTGYPKEYGDGGDAQYDEPGVEYQMATQFIKNLHILSSKDPKKPILIHMKTCGGYWEEGMAIFDAIRACPNPTTILSYTHARSMSSIILQAADKRVLMPHSYFLFHEGTLALSGTSKVVLSMARWEEKITGPTMLDIYSHSLKKKGKYSKHSPAWIKAMLQKHMNAKEDVHLTAREAVDWGFADEVFGAGGRFDWESLRKFS